MLRGGRQHINKEVTAYDAGVSMARARVVNPPFYDTTGERMNA